MPIVVQDFCYALLISVISINTQSTNKLKLK